MPACFSMLLSVPIGISRKGCGTVTRPGFTGCLNCLWLPRCATSYQPSCFKRWMTSRLDTTHDTHFLHTRQVGFTGAPPRLQRINQVNFSSGSCPYRKCHPARTPLKTPEKGRQQICSSLNDRATPRLHTNAPRLRGVGSRRLRLQGTSET